MASSMGGELRLEFKLVGLDRAEKEVTGFAKIAKTALITNVVQKGFDVVTNTVKDVITSTIEVGKQFQKSMSNVAAISGATGSELEALTAKAQEMGRNTVWSASDAADAMSYMAMAGWKTGDMLEGIGGVMNLATAAGADLATTSDIVTDALTAFGLSAKDSGRLADVMAAASSNANTNVGMLGETFKYAAPIAGALGYSIEDTAVAIGMMANAGIKGSQAGTSMRSMLTRLASPTKETNAAMKALGISITETDGTMKPLSKVMNDLRASFQKLNPEQQASYAKAIAGQEAMSGLLAIVNGSDADFSKLTSAIADSNGAAAEMAAIMGDNLDGKLATLQSKVQDLQIKGFNALEPAINVVVDALSWCADNANILLPIVGGLTAAFVAWKIETLLVNSALLANPIGLIVGAVAGLIAGIILLWNNCEGFRNFVMGMMEAIGSAIGAVGEFIGGVISTISTAIGVAGKFIGGVFSAIGEIATTIFEAIWNFISPIVDLLVLAFENWWKTVSAIFGFLWDVVSSVFGLIFDNISGTIGMIANIFSGLWEGIKAGLSAIGNFFKSVFDGVWGVISGVVNAMKDAFLGGWNFIKSIFSSVASFFGNIFGAAWNTVKNIFSTGGKIFSGMVDGIANAFRNIVNAIIGGINKVVAVPFNAINGFLGGLRGIDILGFKPFSWVGTINVPQIPTFATGGIVSGNDYSGDHNLIRANSGEMVITRSQQAALWDMIERGNYGDYDEPDGGTIDNSSIDITNNYQINSALDAEEMGDIILESIRKAVI